jgi:hypothetical protein
MWNWVKKVYGSVRLKRDTEKDNRWELNARVRMEAENRPKIYGRQARVKMISRLAGIDYQTGANFVRLPKNAVGI